MTSIPALMPSRAFRDELSARGGSKAAQCYQCATCSSVCELAPPDAPFPRRQMLWAQWGLGERLAADPSVWLCHQCNDCSVRCPRDARPGDVLQSVRAMVVEKLAAPAFMGKLVANAKSTWPLLVGGPILLWILILTLVPGSQIPDLSGDFVAGQFEWHYFVPYPFIYTVYTLVSLWVLGAIFASGRRYWTALGANTQRSGSFLQHLIPALIEIATHARFAKCSGETQRRWGHFFLMWGFVGAAVTSGFAILYLYKTQAFFWLPLGDATYPVPITHWVKWFGNLSAVALVVGGIMLYLNRLTDSPQVGATTAFDRFFLWTMLGVIVTGVVTEILRFVATSEALVFVGCGVYVLHLGVVFTLFITFPYSKFAHLPYRTLALVHERLADQARQDARSDEH
jgi:quinone-modifying oxidoreductase subunit QmoC